MQPLDTPENWDKASAGYAEKVAPRLMESFSDAFVERLQPESGHAALEVAAGSGAFTVALAPRVGSLLATDFSPAMVRLLEDRIVQALQAIDVDQAVVPGRTSAGGKYRTHNIRMTIRDRAEMQRIDGALRKVPGVKFVL